ncbi:hypothetical protein [Methylocapsa sp. S129]|uniref:hypothetical protein n=1 Tax=Methylocapsa sp. S129 TaxID=1641869 RepID=UPI00131B83E9|nr:hypothetical protein [Methylocapsa sp. S129]
MKRFAIGLAALVIAGGSGLAAAPWKDMPSSVGDGYSESMGTTLAYPGRDSANASNCYDACAAIWGAALIDESKPASRAPIAARNDSAVSASSAPTKGPAT